MEILNEKGALIEFDIMVYPITVIIAIGDVGEDIDRLYKPSNPDYLGLRKPTEIRPAATYDDIVDKETESPCELIWINTLNDCRGSYMCHEAGHAALDIFKFVGAEVDADNQEPYCYLLSTIYKCINSAYVKLKDYKPKPKKSKKKNVQ